MASDPFSYSVSTETVKALGDDGTASLSRGPMVFSGVGGQQWGYGTPYGDTLTSRLGGLLPGSKFDYEREAGDICGNSIFAICLGWAADNFPNAKIEVLKESTNKPVTKHPLTMLFRQPNPGYSARALWSAVLLSLKVDGNAYLMKARGMGGFGPPIQLWWVPHWSIFPQWPTGPTTTYIDHYKYVVDGRVYRLDPKDVIHIKDGIDPLNTRMGLGRIKAQLRNIVGTNEADGYTASILRNMGVPAVMFSPDGDFLIGDPQAKEILRRWKLQVGGENRGNAWVNSLKVKAEKLGLSPQELSLDTILDRPVAGICASSRVSPMVVGLPDTQRTYSNYGEARKAAWEDCLTPTQDMIAEEGLQTQLLNELGDPSTEIVSWDRSKVPALQEGADLRANRAVQLFTNNLSYRDEARKLCDLDPIDGENVKVWYTDTLGSTDDEESPDDDEEPSDDEDESIDDDLSDDEDSDSEPATKALRLGKVKGPKAKRGGAANPALSARAKFDESKHPRQHGKFAAKPDPMHGGRSLVKVAPHKLDKAWQKDTGFHVGPGGTGAAKPGAYREAQANIEKGRTHTPLVSLDKQGVASFTDGRHHFAASRDNGAGHVTVSVPTDQAKRFHQRFGPDAPKGQIAKREHVMASEAENQIVKGVGGKNVALQDGKYHPADVRLTHRGTLHHVEVKTKLDGSKGTYTIHHDAIHRKAMLQESTPNSMFHTVVLDLRDKTGKGKYSGHDMYYKRGVSTENHSGYALSKMHKVKSHAELKRLIQAQDHELPEAARGMQPKVTPELKAKAEKAHASRLAKDRKLKARKRAERQASA